MSSAAKIKLGRTTTLQKKKDGFMVSEIFGVCVSGYAYQDPEVALKEVINRIKPYNKPKLP